MEVSAFSDIEQEFTARIGKMVWCSVATVDTQGRPRSRVLHPIWEGTVGWIATGPNSHKRKHLERNPHLSLAYIADVLKPVYVDCTAEWITDRVEHQRIWELFKTTPPPMGYDPTPIFNTIDRFGLLKLTPWRIEIAQFPGEGRVWRVG